MILCSFEFHQCVCFSYQCRAHPWVYHNREQFTRKGFQQRLLSLHLAWYWVSSIFWDQASPWFVNCKVQNMSMLLSILHFSFCWFGRKVIGKIAAWDHCFSRSWYEFFRTRFVHRRIHMSCSHQGHFLRVCFLHDGRYRFGWRKWGRFCRIRTGAFLVWFMFHHKW